MPFENAFFFKKKTLKQITRLGERLVEASPNSKIISLGQTLSWSVEAAKMAAQNQGATLETNIIPFSGSFLHRSPHEPDSWKFVKAESNFPSPEELSWYKKLLEKKGFTPRLIIDDYQKTGKKTTLVDFCYQGSGVASFLYVFLSSDAKNALEALKTFDLLLVVDKEAIEKTSPPDKITTNFFEIPDFGKIPVRFLGEDFFFLFGVIGSMPFPLRLTPWLPVHLWSDESRLTDFGADTGKLKAAIKEVVERKKLYVPSPLKPLFAQRRISRLFSWFTRS